MASFIYCIVAILPLIYLCSAGPVPLESDSVQPDRPALGFPSQYLPPVALQVATSNLSQDNGLDVKSPLNPDKVRSLRTNIRYSFGGKLPNGGELVMSLSSTIYYAWVDTANEPIKTRNSARKIPFPAFLYILTPSLRPYPLTPFKAGIAYCRILQDVLKQRSWPAYIHTEMFELIDVWIGTSEIDYTPQSSAAATSAGSYKEEEQLRSNFFPNSNDSSVASPNGSADNATPKIAVSKDFERRWFTCVSTALLFILEKTPSDRVTDTLPNPTSEPISYHIDCVPNARHKDRVVFVIYSGASQPQRHFTWDALAKTLLIFGTRVAEDQDGWDSAQAVVAEDRTVTGLLVIRIDSTNGATASE